MTAEMLHDALSLLPSDLITAADKLRTQPRKAVIQWRHWISMAACAAVILGCGLIFARKALPAMGGSSKDAAIGNQAAADYAPQEPAAMYSNEKFTEAAAEEAASSSVTGGTAHPSMEESEERLTPTGYPADGAYFIDLSAVQVCLTNQLVDSTLCIDSSQTSILRSREVLDTYYTGWSDCYYDMGRFLDACAAYDDDWFTAYDLLVIRVGTEKSELVPSIKALTLTGAASCEITLGLTEFPEDNTLDPACWHILLPVEKGILPEGTAIDIILESAQ